MINWKGVSKVSISDIIEQYLKEILHANEKKVIEIKRSEIANQFECVPSQINYVINTRFTFEKGYLIESKRGGGGYIRITRVEYQDEFQLIDEIIAMINPMVSEQGALDVLERLREKKLINLREEHLIISALQREVLNLPLPDRDHLRARILTNILTTLKYINSKGEERDGM
ncbi:CtsR family transcriptional regulator [Pseudogracilibacillus sp. SO10305]|uniref:CtsR family transcriptional regulator n=1 Tax=Pseudogracilibacillus sp. SO10305 TaxID=3098292 RepID=UPI003FA78B8A